VVLAGRGVNVVLGRLVRHVVYGLVVHALLVHRWRLLVASGHRALAQLPALIVVVVVAGHHVTVHWAVLGRAQVGPILVAHLLLPVLVGADLHVVAVDLDL